MARTRTPQQSRGQSLFVLLGIESVYALTEGLISGAFSRGLGVAPCAARFVPSPFHG